MTNLTNTISELDAIIAKLSVLLEDNNSSLSELKETFAFASDEEVVDAFKQAMLNAPDTYITQLCRSGVIKPLNFSETERYQEPSIESEVFTDVRYEQKYISAEERDEEFQKQYEAGNTKKEPRYCPEIICSDADKALYEEWNKKLINSDYPMYDRLKSTPGVGYA